jgi:hypothetical protein
MELRKKVLKDTIDNHIKKNKTWKTITTAGEIS